MKRDAEPIGRVEDEAQVSAAGQVPGADATEAGPGLRKADPDAEWQSMTTGDPALYLKDVE